MIITVLRSGHIQKEAKAILCTFFETGQVEPTIPVPLQQSYTGEGVITTTMANTPCLDLGINGVLKWLNAIAVTLDHYFQWFGMNSADLSLYIDQGFDFGTTYAYWHRYWNDIPPQMEQELHILEWEDEQMRRDVLFNGRIIMREVPP